MNETLFTYIITNQRLWQQLHKLKRKENKLIKNRIEKERVKQLLLANAIPA